MKTNTFNGRSIASISFSKSSGTPQKDKSTYPYLLPQMISNTMVIAIICMYIYNIIIYIYIYTYIYIYVCISIYICSPGLTSESLGRMSLSHMSHNVSLVPHQFTHPKLNSCPSSPNQTFTQAFWSGGTVTYPAPQTRNLEVILSNSLSNSLQILSYLTISTSTRIIQATSISYLELLPYPPTDFLNFILVVVVQSLSCV